MAEEVQNLWVGGFNPSLYKLLENSFEKYFCSFRIPLIFVVKNIRQK